LKKYDIHWRNIELIRQFVTPNGNLKNRIVNRLSAGDQKNISRAVKTARHMCAMPFYGKTPAPLKRNITSL
jgi:ribosomal protein S18